MEFPDLPPGRSDPPDLDKKKTRRLFAGETGEYPTLAPLEEGNDESIENIVVSGQDLGIKPKDHNFIVNKEIQEETEPPRVRRNVATTLIATVVSFFIGCGIFLLSVIGFNPEKEEEQPLVPDTSSSNYDDQYEIVIPNTIEAIHVDPGKKINNQENVKDKN